MFRRTLHFAAVFVVVIYAWMLITGTNPAKIKAHIVGTYAAHGG